MAEAAVYARPVTTDADPYAAPLSVASADQCLFYHKMDIPGHGEVGGQWDLRGREDEYLGHVELAGARVLEIGPASGFLTFHMERRGAEVVAVELGPDADWDVVPHARLDLQQILAQRRAGMVMLRNGFWFAHERLKSLARVHYGSAYHLPPAMGRFDVAVMASVLLHTRDPLRIIEGCAAVADTVVVADLHEPALDGLSAMQFFPTAESGQWDTWWRLGPDGLARFLEVIGFERVVVTHHEQLYVDDGLEHPVPVFTLVAHRAPPPPAG